MIRFTKPVHRFSPDQAGKAVDMVDRRVWVVDVDTYDDLLLVASGHAALLTDPRASRPEKMARCGVCGKEFTALRSNAELCSEACKQRRRRTRKRTANSQEGPDVPG